MEEFMLRFDEGQIYKSRVQYSREGDGGGTLWSKANDYHKYTVSAAAIEKSARYKIWVLGSDDWAQNAIKVADWGNFYLHGHAGTVLWWAGS